MKQKKLLGILMAVVLSFSSLPVMAVQAMEAIGHGRGGESEGQLPELDKDLLEGMSEDKNLSVFSEEGSIKKSRAEDLEKSLQQITPHEGNIKTANNVWEGYRYRELEDGTVEITGYAGDDTELVIPAKMDGKRVSSIGAYAVEDYECLISIELPANVTSVGESAFSGCSSLTEIKLPASLTNIGDGAFAECSSLSEIIVENNNPAFTSQDGILYDKNKENLICCPAGKTGTITILETVTSIRGSAFRGCRNLTRIDLPMNLIDIGNDAFMYCSSLTEIELPEGLTSTGSGVFWGCSNLERIGLPEGLTDIGECAFHDCSSLTEIELPISLTRISAWAFVDCSSLAELELPAGLSYIGYGAFVGCSSLTEIKLPAGLNYIDSCVFSGCNGLTEIIVDENNPKYMSQDGILYDKNQTILIRCLAKKAGSVTIPESVTSIYDAAFSGCSGLTSIELPAALLL